MRTVPGTGFLPRFALSVLMIAACAAPAAAGDAKTPPPAPAPYSLPWLLRPAAAANVLRVDETVALFADPATGASGSTAVTSLTGSYRAGKRFAPVVRLSWVTNDPSDNKPSGAAFSNPLVGLTGGASRGPWRGTGFAAVTLAVGGGGGSNPDAGAAEAVSRAASARSAMDNALFAVNYWTTIVGANVAHVDRNFTVQAEATLLRLTRNRGRVTGDATRTNFTAGVHVGRFLTKQVSVGAELRLQRWLTDAAPVRSNSDARETVTAAIGPRFHIPLANKRALRPGLSWTHAIDRPLMGQSYDMFQLDVPWSF